MKNSEKGMFEDVLKMAFEDAEQAPSQYVWAGIEQSLDKAEHLVVKRNLIFYQRLAAASILFALLLGGLSTYYISNLQDLQKQNIVEPNGIGTSDNHALNNITPSADQEIRNQTKAGNTSKDDMSSIASNSSNNENVFVTVLVNQSDDSSIVSKEQVDYTSQSKKVIARTYPSPTSRIPEPLITLHGKMNEVTIVRKLPAMPSSMMTSKKEKPSGESLWTSLGASTGNFSPSADFTSGSSSKAYAQSSTASGNFQGAYSTSAPKGSAYSVGMNLGKRLSKRWLVQGGVSYLNQSIGYTSNYAMVDGSNKVYASVADYDYSNLNSFSAVIPLASTYEINSVNEFISLPIQAGYLLLDRKIGLQLNSGVSTDFFMQNTLIDKSGQLAGYSTGAGDHSPFRSINWSGLLGTELSYKIATHYRISVAPGLRYSLNSVLKSDVSSSNPLVWDVGFRFRYIIK